MVLQLELQVNLLAVHLLVLLAPLRLQEVIQALSAMHVLLVSSYLDLRAYHALQESLAAWLEVQVKVKAVPHLALLVSSET